MVLAEALGQVAHFARREIHLADIAIVVFDKGDLAAVGRPVGPLAVVAQLFMVRRRIVEYVRSFQGLVVGIIDRHASSSGIKSNSVRKRNQSQSARAPEIFT